MDFDEYLEDGMLHGGSEVIRLWRRSKFVCGFWICANVRML